VTAVLEYNKSAINGCGHYNTDTPLSGIVILNRLNYLVDLCWEFVNLSCSTGCCYLRVYSALSSTSTVALAYKVMLWNPAQGRKC